MELREDRERLTAEIDQKIRHAEGELEALVHPGEEEAASNGGGIQDRIVAAVSREPGIEMPELTVLIYDEDTVQNRHKLRASVYALRQKGRIMEDPRTGGLRIRANC